MKISLPFTLLLLAAPALAHHGVASVGAAGLEGPGAPIEAAASAVLPAGSTLAYLKVDNARFKTYEWAQPNATTARFTLLGVGHGFSPWFSAYLFAPYNIKLDQAGGQDSRGWADISVLAQVGFKYDRGFQLVPANESLDDLEDWHFSVFGGGTLPTGQANHRLADGRLDPGKALGFGKPSWTLGLTASKQLSTRLTLSLEASALRFREYGYADGQHVLFGAENRFNMALAYRAYSDGNLGIRFDPVLEAQFLELGRDRESGAGALGTGGRLLYVVPGVRAYWRNMSFALGVKKPVWTRLNEADQQQGSEGREKYRLIFSASCLF